MLPRVRVAHGPALPVDAVGGEPALEGLGGIGRKGLAHRAQGGRGQLRPPRQQVVQVAAHEADHILDVVRILEPTLDLEAHHAGLRQAIQVPREVQVSDVQQVLLPHHHPARAIHQVPGCAAGLGALAAVAAAVADGAAQIAVPALTHAESPVDKGLQLHVCGPADGPDVVQAQLPGEDGPGEAGAGEKGHALGAVTGRLGAGVQGQRWEVHLQVGHVLDDQGVHACLVEPPGLLPRLLQLVVVDQGIECRVDLRTPEPGLAGELLEVGQFVARGLAGAEQRAAHVDRVRPAAQRKGSLFQVFGGSKQFEGHGPQSTSRSALGPIRPRMGALTRPDHQTEKQETADGADDTDPLPICVNLRHLRFIAFLLMNEENPT